MGGRVVKVGDRVKVRGAPGGPWPVLRVAPVFDVWEEKLGSRKTIATHQDVVVLGGARTLLAGFALAFGADGFPADSAVVPQAACDDGAAIRSKARARARWFRKHGPTLARLACGVGASLWAILYILVATR